MGQTNSTRAITSATFAVVLLLAAGCHTIHPNATALPPAPLLTNTDVISMSANGLSDETIIAAIRSQPSQLDVSPAALIDMKTNGVSEQVLQAMQTGPPRAPVVIAHPRPVVVEPAVHVGFPFFVGGHHRPHPPRRHHRPTRFSLGFWHGW